MASKTTFISYSSQDVRLIEGVTKMLRTQGKIFRDKDSIAPGEKWKESIDKAIEKASQVIVFWCCHSAGSDWVKYELLKALELKKPIIPVLCCGYKVDPEIKQFQWIDMKGLVLHECTGHAGERALEWNHEELEEKEKSIVYPATAAKRKKRRLVAKAIGLIVVFIIAIFTVYKISDFETKKFDPGALTEKLSLPSMVPMILVGGLLLLSVVAFFIWRGRKSHKQPAGEPPKTLDDMLSGIKPAELMVYEALRAIESKPYAYYPAGFGDSSMAQG